jgi:EAL domain-containing protein (putative c-di-GMP-specific phosphodiesterase class I)
MSSTPLKPVGCRACREPGTAPDFTMAFQPIIDSESGEVFAHEALVRPVGGGSAYEVLSQITAENRYAFDQACRVKAISLAAALGMRSLLNINFLPNAVYQPAACIRATLEAATRTGFPLTQIVFEVTEDERSRDAKHLMAIFTEYRRHGMRTAIDDFGAGHSGLNLLAQFQPDIVKIDMALTRDIHTDRVRRTITRSIAQMCAQLGITVIAEGIESLDEALCLRDLGIHLLQGYYFARPQIEALPPIDNEASAALRSASDVHAYKAMTLFAR